MTCFMIGLIVVIILICVMLALPDEKPTEKSFPDYFPCRVESLMWDTHDWEVLKDKIVCRRCGWTEK